MKNFTLLFVSLFLYGIVNSQTVTDFFDIQFIDPSDLISGDDLSYLDGDTVTVRGVVTSDPCDYALSSSGSRMGTFLQDSMATEWGGVHILIDPSASGYSGSLKDLNDASLFVDNFKVGNVVQCRALVSSFDDNTQLLLLPEPSSITGFSTLPAPVPQTIDVFMQSDGGGGQIPQKVTGEPWEGIYVEFDSVFVVDVSASSTPGRWFWSLQDEAGNKIQVRDVFGDFRNDTNDDECPDWLSGTPGVSNTPNFFEPPAIGSKLEYFRGVIVDYVGEYFIAPTDTNDVGPLTFSVPVVSNLTADPAVPTSSETVTITADIFDPDGSVVSADLNYSFGLGNTTFTTVAMAAGAGDSYSATIPASGSDSTYVNYWIKAVDDAGFVTNFPDTLASGSFYITYDDGINSIARIQNTPFEGGGSIWAGDSIANMNIEAIVTSTTQTYDLGLVALQDGVSEWSGIFVQSSPGDGTDLLFRGDEIRITSAEVVEQFGVTYLADMTFEVLSSGNPLPVFRTDLIPDSIDAEVFLRSEPYEGMLLRFDNAFVTSNNADAPSTFGEFRINTVNVPETGLRVDDVSFEVPFEFGVDSVVVGEELDFIQGVLYFSFSNFKLLPRDLNDIAGYSTFYPKSVVAFSFNGLSPAVNGAINQDMLTIDATVPFGTDVTNLTPTVEFTGQFLDPASGTAQDFTNPVTYTVTAPVDGSTTSYEVTITVEPGTGIELLGSIQNMQWYPNPTEGIAYVDLQLKEADQFNFLVTDIIGRLVFEKEHELAPGQHRLEIDLSGEENGMYLFQISNSKGSFAEPIQIMK